VSIQNCLVSGLYLLSGILNTRKNNILETGYFSSSGEGREPSALLGPLQRANLNHWTIHVEVEATLQLMVSQSVCQVNVKPALGLVTRYYFLSESCCLVSVGRPL
jgi:hypothetical protein